MLSGIEMSKWKPKWPRKEWEPYALKIEARQIIRVLHLILAFVFSMFAWSTWQPPSNCVGLSKVIDLIVFKTDNNKTSRSNQTMHNKTTQLTQHTIPQSLLISMFFSFSFRNEQALKWMCQIVLQPIIIVIVIIIIIIIIASFPFSQMRR